jgi:ligand-binding sensor domain-containing protein
LLKLPAHFYTPLLLGFLLAFTACSGQELNKGTETKTEQPDQQIADFVVSAFQDSKGNLWFGTMAYGVARYDGKQLRYFSIKDGLESNTVAHIAEDTAGNIWLGTHNGADRFDGTSFTHFGVEQGLHGPGCKFLIDRNGTIWAGTNHGLFQFDGTRFNEFMLTKPTLEEISYKWELGKIWSLIEDSKGNLWFGRDGLGLCRFDGTNCTHFTEADGLCSNNVTSIVEDDQGRLWISAISSDNPETQNKGGLTLYDGKTFTQFPEVKGLSQNDIYLLYKDSKGAIWICALDTGLYRYANGQFTLFDKNDRMDLTQRFAVQGVQEDKNGTLWLGFSGGLFRFDGKEIKNVTKNGPWD